MGKQFPAAAGPAQRRANPKGPCSSIRNTVSTSKSSSILEPFGGFGLGSAMGLYDKIFGRSFKEQDVTYAGLVNKPNGGVSYALQVGHLGMPIRDGYAGTKASGAPDLLLEENWARQTHDVLDI